MVVEQSKMGIILFVKMSTLWKLRLYSWNLLLTCHFNPLFTKTHENILVSEITSIYLSAQVNNFKTTTNWKIPIFWGCFHIHWGFWKPLLVLKCILTLYFSKFVRFFSSNITYFRLKYLDSRKTEQNGYNFVNYNVNFLKIEVVFMKYTFDMSLLTPYLPQTMKIFRFQKSPHYLSTLVYNFKTATNWKIPIF